MWWCVHDSPRDCGDLLLDRQELAQAQLEDLSSTIMGKKDQNPEYTDEEVVSETVYDGGEELRDVHQNEHLHPARRGIARGHAGDGMVKSAVLQRAEPRTAKTTTMVTLQQRQARMKGAEARLKGYEGDPCSSSGAFTLVRNGTGLKCVSCSLTSGCS